MGEAGFIETGDFKLERRDPKCGPFKILKLIASWRNRLARVKEPIPPVEFVPAKDRGTGPVGALENDTPSGRDWNP